MQVKNVYLPKLARITQVIEEVEGFNPINTYRMEFENPDDWFDFDCGQCAMITVFGKGEAMFSISSAPHEKGYLQFSIIKTGRVTTAIHDMEVGDVVGIRGPYGNAFPVDDWEGKDLYFFGGGCGLAPVWSVLHTALAKKEKFGQIALICGGRTPGEILYNDQVDDLCSHMPVVKGVRKFFADQPIKLENTAKAVGITCGPPVMIKAVIQNLEKMGFRDELIYTTVENKMKCGIGKCGRCNVGKDYLCTKGPVYNWAQLKALPQEY